MKKLVVILPRGEAIKNFVYSGITDSLRKHYKLVFFSVVPNQEIKQYLENKCDVFFELLSTKEEVEKRSLNYNEILKIAHAKKLNSTTGNLKLLKDDLLSKKTMKSAVIRIVRKVIAKFYTSDKRIRKLTNKLITVNFKSKNVKYYETLLREIKPDLVFNTSHIHNKISFNLLYAVKKLHLKTAAFLFSWDNLTSQGRIVPEYDYYFTWNNKIKQDLLNIYPFIKAKSIFVSGTPQFDFHFNKKYILSKKELYKFLNISEEKKIVLYSTGMAYYTPKEHVIVEEIERVLKKTESNLQLVVRIYAKDDNTVYYKLRDSNTNICIPNHYWEENYLTPTKKDITLFNSLLNYCFLGINVASTVSLDLAIINKPIINIAFNPPGEDIYPNNYAKIYDFEHYKPIANSGAISVVYSLHDLEKELKKYQSDVSYKEEERKQLVTNFFGKELHTNKPTVFVNIFKSILN